MATRFPVLTLNLNGALSLRAPLAPLAGVTAGQIQTLNAFAGAGPASGGVGAGVSAAIPELCLPVGTGISSYTYNLQTGDSWSQIVLTFELS